MKTENTMATSDDLIASYSSRGPTNVDLIAKPDVVAPGNLVDSLLAPGSTLASEYPGNVLAASGLYHAPVSGTPLYFSLSGTSMATPVVSGAAALMIEKDPTLTPDTVKARLMKTASKTLSSDEHGHRSDHRPDLHRLLRHVHGGRGLREHRRRSERITIE